MNKIAKNLPGILYKVNQTVLSQTQAEVLINILAVRGQQFEQSLQEIFNFNTQNMQQFHHLFNEVIQNQNAETLQAPDPTKQEQQNECFSVIITLPDKYSHITQQTYIQRAVCCGFVESIKFIQNKMHVDFSDEISSKLFDQLNQYQTTKEEIISDTGEEDSANQKPQIQEMTQTKKPALEKKEKVQQPQQKHEEESAVNDNINPNQSCCICSFSREKSFKNMELFQQLAEITQMTSDSVYDVYEAKRGFGIVIEFQDQNCLKQFNKTFYQNNGNYLGSIRLTKQINYDNYRHSQFDWQKVLNEGTEDDQNQNDKSDHSE